MTKKDEAAVLKLLYAVCGEGVDRRGIAWCCKEVSGHIAALQQERLEVTRELEEIRSALRTIEAALRN